MSCVQERLWLWGHAAGSHNNAYDLPGQSRMTPIEGAFYLGIPNLIMVRYHDQPPLPFQQYAIPFKALKDVVWSIVGAGGANAEEETAEVFGLVDHLPNMTGVIMDDFFRKPEKAEDVGMLSVAELVAIRERLAALARKLDLWVVLYAHQLELPIREHLELCDKVTLWTWEAPDLADLERNFDAVEKLAPSCGKVLGCYMWDYGKGQPMPLELMQRQCETALEWLRQGRIEGIIFLASCIGDLGLETVEWTRRWIAQVAGQEL